MQNFPAGVTAGRLSLLLADGQLLAARCWRAVKKSNQAVVCLHGVMSHAGWFDALAYEFAAQGISTFCADRRGSGEHRHLLNPHDPDAWIDDIFRLVAAVSKEYAETTLLCWCWGAKTGTIATVQGLAIKRLVYLAPGLIPAPQIRKKIISTSIAESQQTPFLFDPIKDFSDNPGVQEFISTDPLRWKNLPGAFLKPSRIIEERSLHSFPRLKAKILCVLASRDKIVDNSKTRNIMATHCVEEFDGCHAIVLEQPAYLANRISDWLKSSQSI